MYMDEEIPLQSIVLDLIAGVIKTAEEHIKNIRKAIAEHDDYTLFNLLQQPIGNRMPGSVKALQKALANRVNEHWLHLDYDEQKQLILHAAKKNDVDTLKFLFNKLINVDTQLYSQVITEITQHSMLCDNHAAVEYLTEKHKERISMDKEIDITKDTDNKIAADKSIARKARALGTALFIVKQHIQQHVDNNWCLMGTEMEAEEVLKEIITELEEKNKTNIKEN